jgi:hypothetical protein
MQRRGDCLDVLVILRDPQQEMTPLLVFLDTKSSNPLRRNSDSSINSSVSEEISVVSKRKATKNLSQYQTLKKRLSDISPWL